MLPKLEIFLVCAYGDVIFLCKRIQCMWRRSRKRRSLYVAKNESVVACRASSSDCGEPQLVKGTIGVGFSYSIIMVWLYGLAYLKIRLEKFTLIGTDLDTLVRYMGKRDVAALVWCFLDKELFFRKTCVHGRLELLVYPNENVAARMDNAKLFAVVVVLCTIAESVNIAFPGQLNLLSTHTD